jgi:hypothetical protein
MLAAGLVARRIRCKCAMYGCRKDRKNLLITQGAIHKFAKSDKN